MVKKGATKKVIRVIGKAAIPVISAVSYVVNPTAVVAQQNIPPADQKELLAQFEFYQGRKVTKGEVYKSNRTESGYEVIIDGKKRYDSIFSMDLDGDGTFGGFEEAVLEGFKPTGNFDIDKLPLAERKKFYDAIDNKNSGEIDYSRNKPSDLETSVSLSGGFQAEFGKTPQGNPNNFYGGTVGVSIDTKYDNGFLLGIGIKGSVLGGEKGLVFVQENNDLGNGTQLRTMTTQEMAEVYKAMLKFKVGGNNFYGSFGGGVSIRTGQNTDSIDQTTMDGSMVKPGTPNIFNYTKVVPVASVGAGVQISDTFGIEAGTAVDIIPGGLGNFAPFIYGTVNLGGGK